MEECICPPHYTSTHCPLHGSCTCCHGACCPTHDEPERLIPLTEFEQDLLEGMGAAVGIIRTSFSNAVTPQSLAKEICPHFCDNWSEHECLYYVGESYAAISESCDDLHGIIDKLIALGRVTREEVSVIGSDVFHARKN